MSWNFNNFKKEEFTCQHCGAEGINVKLVERLQKLRDLYGKPIKISSGYRCDLHPIEAKKKIGGTHNQGLAVDILIEKENAYKLLELAFKLKFYGIGVNQKGKNRFIHLDISEKQNRPNIWSY